MLILADKTRKDCSQSGRKITLSAPAKINIGLRILGKRPDDFHELITIMQRISLSDYLTISLSDAKKADRRGAKHPGKDYYYGPTLTRDPAENLCIRAAKSFREEFDLPADIRIDLEKHIPAGAGLGGGSSDAAAVFRGLAQLCDITSDDENLLKLAARLGSDIPFFMQANSAALVQGRGERITPIEALAADLRIVVISTGFEISTAWAYRSIDRFLTFDEIDIKLLIRDFLEYKGGVPTGEMGNDFEKPVFAAHPVLSEALDRLKDAGALFAMMPGSGSSIYGVFRERDLRKALALDWHEAWSCFICRPW